jgi:hypothetical protein
MTSRQQIEDALDAVREDRSFYQLRAIIAAFACSYRLSQPDLDDVVGDCARKIVGELKKGTVTPTIANMLGKIVHNTVRSLMRKQKITDDKRDDVDPDAVEGTQGTRDPLALIADDESVREIFNDLQAIREENERYYVALTALVDGESVGERHERHFGKQISKDTEYKLTQRAREKLSSIISKRKEGIL